MMHEARILKILGYTRVGSMCDHGYGQSFFFSKARTKTLLIGHSVSLLGTIGCTAINLDVRGDLPRSYTAELLVGPILCCAGWPKFGLGHICLSRRFAICFAAFPLLSSARQAASDYGSRPRRLTLDHRHWPRLDCLLQAT